MKTAISIPDDIFEAGERTPAMLGLSRSGLYAMAVGKFVDRHDTAGVTERLDPVYAEHGSSLDPNIRVTLPPAVLSRPIVAIHCPEIL